MKQFYPIQKEKNSLAKKAVLVIAFAFIGLVSFSQQMVFQNPVLVSGSNGADGAVYRFSNVVSNVDALVTINGRSNCLVTLKNIDATNTGYNNAFQPIITYNNGNVSGNTSWYMEFLVTFVQTGTKLPMAQDTVTSKAISIDGDGSMLKEQFSPFNFATCTMYNPTSLTSQNITGGSQITGPCTSYGIDSTKTQVITNQTYLGATQLTFRFGATVSSGCGSSNSTRTYSIFFNTSNTVHTLPMQLTAFTAQLNTSTDQVMLDWTTTSEINASRFVIQRSTDGVNYDDIAMVFTQEGNSNSLRQYSYADNISSVNSSLVYYRLQMVDMDGTYSFSNINLIKMAGETAQSNIVVFPNPAVSQLQITIPDSWQGKMVSYIMYNSNGALVKQISSSNAGQTETMNISDLPVGVYFVKAANGNQSSVQRIVKINN